MYREMLSLSFESKATNNALKMGGGGRLFEVSPPVGTSGGSLVPDLDLQNELFEYLANIPDQEADLLVNGSGGDIPAAPWNASQRPMVRPPVNGPSSARGPASGESGQRRAPTDITGNVLVVFELRFVYSIWQQYHVFCVTARLFNC